MEKCVLGVKSIFPSFKEVSKDDSDLSPDDIIVDPKTHHTYKKGRLIGKGGFAKVYEVSRICTGEPMASDTETLADKIIDKEVFSRRSTSKDKVKREILLHKDLIHPNIVRFYNFFSDGKSSYHCRGHSQFTLTFTPYKRFDIGKTTPKCQR